MGESWKDLDFPTRAAFSVALCVDAGFVDDFQGEGEVVGGGVVDEEDGPHGTFS